VAREGTHLAVALEQLDGLAVRGLLEVADVDGVLDGTASGREGVRDHVDAVGHVGQDWGAVAGVGHQAAGGDGAARGMQHLFAGVRAAWPHLCEVIAAPVQENRVGEWALPVQHRKSGVHRAVGDERRKQTSGLCCVVKSARADSNAVVFGALVEL